MKNCKLHTLVSMVTAHSEMQVDAVACETHFRTCAHKDGLGSALNKCVCLCVCPQFLLFWWKATPFFIAPQAILGICYTWWLLALYDPRSHGRMLSQTLLVSHSVSFSACQLVKNRYRSREKQVNPVQLSLQHNTETFSASHIAGRTSFPLGFAHMGQTLSVDDPCCLWYLLCIAIL